MSFTSRFGNYQVVDEPWYKSEGGVANGVATLDGTGVVPISQLPAAVVGSLKYKGTWNANTNTPTLSNGGGGGDLGDYYVVSVAGTTSIDGVSDWQVGDWIVNNGSLWEKIDNTDVVTSVNSKVGAVTLNLSEILAQGTATGAYNISINAGQTLNFNVGSGGALNSISTTAVRAWNLPDASGTIALLSDIPATPTLSAVLTAGNTTGANDISVDSGQKITFGGAGKYIDDSSSSLKLISDTTIRAETTNSFLRIDNTTFEVTNNNTGNLKSFNVQYLADRVQYRNAVAGLSLSYALVTANRVQTLQDANGTIALLSDIPASIVTGTGTTNYSTRWTSASTIGDGILQDNGTTTSIGASPNGNIDLLISTTRTSGIVVNNSGTNAEQYAYGSSMNGASTLSVGVNLQIANATTNVGIRVASGSLPNTTPTIGYDYGVHITAKGSTQGNIGGYFRATGGTSRNALWLVDGTEGDGKVLTSDADGKTSWQTIRTGEVYSVTGLTTDRTFNANSVTLNELADVVGTLITDLQGVNILS